MLQLALREGEFWKKKGFIALRLLLLWQENSLGVSVDTALETLRSLLVHQTLWGVERGCGF